MKALRRFPTIIKLQKIFKQGYIPSRMGQSYVAVKQANIPNCFAHACFNLTNSQLQDFNEADFNAFRGFIQSIFQSNRSITKDLLEFVKECGLKVSKTNSSLPRNDNEWKVAIYFGTERFQKEYHFLFQERDGSWSGKCGSTNRVTSYPTAPKKLDYNFETPYILYGIYKIKNPYASKHKQKDDNEIEL